MSDQRPKRETKSIEEATNSNMWQNAALIERLHEKGRVMKQHFSTRSRTCGGTIPRPRR